MNIEVYQRQNEVRFFLTCRAAKSIHCAQNVKTVRLCTEFNESIKNIFFPDMPHIVAFQKIVAHIY